MQFPSSRRATPAVRVDGLGFLVRGIQPHGLDFHLADATTVGRFWAAACRIVLQEKDAELAAGLDRHGKPLARVKLEYRPRFKSGRAVGGPPLTPHEALSRTRRLLVAARHGDAVRVGWAGDWGEVLGFHRDGIPRKGWPGGKVVRDVIGLSPEALKRVADRCAAAWATGTLDTVALGHHSQHGALAIDLPFDAKTALGPAQPTGLKVTAYAGPIAHVEAGARLGRPAGPADFATGWRHVAYKPFKSPPKLKGASPKTPPPATPATPPAPPWAPPTFDRVRKAAHDREYAKPVNIPLPPPPPKAKKPKPPPADVAGPKAKVLGVLQATAEGKADTGDHKQLLAGLKATLKANEAVALAKALPLPGGPIKTKFAALQAIRGLLSGAKPPAAGGPKPSGPAKAAGGPAKGPTPKGTAVSPPKPPKPPAAAQGPPPFPADPDRLEVLKKLGGSTGAELVRDPATGAKFVRKRGKNAGHLREEAAADAVYRAAGLAVPEGQLYETAAGPVKLARFVEGTDLGDLLKADPAAAAKAMAEARKGFAADALFGNWDVAGASFDNLKVGADGKVYRIDNGGALRYRAQGGDKGSKWGDDVGELTSLRVASLNPQAARLFGPLTEAEIRGQVEGLLKRRAEILSAAPAELRARLGKRLDSLELQTRPRAPWATAAPDGWKHDAATHFRERTGEDEINAWGKGAYKKWSQGNSAAENVAVRYYTGSGYRQLNQYLRTGKPASDPTVQAAITDQIPHLDRSLARGRLPEPITVFRKVPSLQALGLKPELIGYGDTISDPGYMSTSVKRGTWHGDVMLTLRVPAGTPGAYVNAAGKWSSHPSELEYLLPRGTKARVVELVKKAGGDHTWEIIVEVIT